MQLVILDVDGTLVDSQHHIVEAQTRAFAAHGLAPPSRRMALGVVGLSLHEAFVALAGRDAPIEGLANAYKDAWHDIRRQPGYADVLYPGARETLTLLHARVDIKLGIATGKSRRGVAALIESQGWRDMFATIQTADDHPSKPHPAMLRAAVAAVGVDAAAAAMVGDTSYDMEMAVAAGVRPLGVAWGYHDTPMLLAVGAERVVEDFDELLRALDDRRTRDAA